MKKLTTPKAILFGFGLIALAIASVPYSSKIVSYAHASNNLTKQDVRDVLNSCTPQINNIFIYFNC